MTENQSPVFELRIWIGFPHEILFVEPPIPTSPFSDSLPEVHTEMGIVRFYFDFFDVPYDNEPNTPPSRLDGFYIHFESKSVPPEIEKLFITTDHDYAAALFNLTDENQDIIALRNKIWIRTDPEPSEERLIRLQVESELREHYEILDKLTKEADVNLFSNPEFHSYFTSLGNHLNHTIQVFLEVLRIKYNQYLIPDRPVIQVSNAYWILSEAAVKSETGEDIERLTSRATSGYRFADEERMKRVAKMFLDRLFPQNRTQGKVSFLQTVKPDEWAVIAEQVEAGGIKPELSEILIATAFGECDERMGNPRVGLIEAVVALEIEIKSLMTTALMKYRISKSSVDRIIRETSLADLVSVWIRREIPEKNESSSDSDDVYKQCAVAIHERNELIHKERRSIKRERALEHITAIAKLVRLTRQIRKTYTDED